MQTGSVASSGVGPVSAVFIVLTSENKHHGHAVQSQGHQSQWRCRGGRGSKTGPDCAVYLFSVERGAANRHCDDQEGEKKVG